MNTESLVRWNADGRFEVLTFDLGEETFALEAGLVQEILDLLPETIVPGAARSVGGLINFRGKVIPLADLRLCFGMQAAEPTSDSRIVVIAFETDHGPVLIGIKRLPEKYMGELQDLRLQT